MSEVRDIVIEQLNGEGDMPISRLPNIGAY